MVIIDNIYFIHYTIIGIASSQSHTKIKWHRLNLCSSDDDTTIDQDTNTLKDNGNESDIKMNDKLNENDSLSIINITRRNRAKMDELWWHQSIPSTPTSISITWY